MRLIRSRVSSPRALFAAVVFSSTLSAASLGAERESVDAPVTEPGVMTQGDPCDSGWQGDLFPAPIGLSGSVADFIIFDDGSGPALIVVGNFNYAGALEVDGIAKWNGAEWETFGGDTLVSGNEALAIFDDGNGPTLYAAGGDSSSGAISRWDDGVWTVVRTTDGMVRALAAADDGTGPKLFAGGDFHFAQAPLLVHHIVMWDGTTWSSVGGGVNDSVLSLYAFDDGSGEAIYVGGKFTTAGTNPAASKLARWRSDTGWQSVGVSPNNYVYAMTTYDDGSGPALIAGGLFNGAGAAPASMIAKWNGAAWSPLGAGVDGIVHSLTVYDTGSGQRLYAGGEFNNAGGAPASKVACWNGAAWSPVGVGTSGPVYAIAGLDVGAGPELYIGGNFFSADGKPVKFFARGDGTQWQPIGNGMDSGVAALQAFDDGSGAGEELYVGGNFTTINDMSVRGVAKWDGNGWSAVGDGPGWTTCFAIFDDGSGPALYAGGRFRMSNGDLFDRIAKWDGATWSDVGGGTSDAVRAMAVYDDGSGPALYVGGNFVYAGGVYSPFIAKWDGDAWIAVGGLTPGSHTCGMQVESMLVHDDGSGPLLWVAGKFQKAGGATVDNIARWNGSSWSGVGTGFPGCLHPGTLALFDDGTGAAVYAGGVFHAPNAPGHIAKWDGANWAFVGGGTSNSVVDLQVYDDGSGPALFAVGSFTAAGGVAAKSLAKWNGSNWSPLGSGTNGLPSCVTVFDDGSVPALFVGGGFTTAGGKVSGNIAKWTGCAAVPPLCLGDGNGDSVVDFDDVNATIGSWLANYGTGTGPGDTNGDGVVNFDDISTTIANWLADCGA